MHHAVSENDDFELCTATADIRRAKAQGKIGAILSFEGREALGSDIRMLDLYYKLGLRIVSLTHTTPIMFANTDPHDGAGCDGP